MERAPARLMELSVSKDAVLRACALHGTRKPGAEEEGEVSDKVVEKVFLLEGVSIFERCSVDDLAALAAIATQKHFAAGTVIYRENDPGDALYVIVEGKVLTEKDGRRILEQSAKEAFGETSLLDGLPRPASTRALTDTRALAIDRQDFLDLLADRPEILQGLFAVLTKQMRQVLELAAAAKQSRGSSLPKAG
ncbi:MAG: cyclic nucleotide-binding domain-containing protein [Myxococcales bacterium]